MNNSRTNENTITQALYEDLIDRINEIGVISNRNVIGLGIAIITNVFQITKLENQREFLKDLQPTLEKWDKRLNDGDEL